MRQLHFIVLLYILKSSYACYSSAGVVVEDDDEDEIITTPSDDNIFSNYWAPPPGHTVADYSKWLNEYTKQKEKSKKKETLSIYPSDADNKWPENWRGVGAGNTGDGPPPWAIVPNGSDMPEYCFLPPVMGNCTKYNYRYGFNPFIEECQEFIYGGCFGNANNFYTKARCEEACMEKPQNPCSVGIHDNLHEYADSIELLFPGSQ